MVRNLWIYGVLLLLFQALAACGGENSDRGGSVQPDGRLLFPSAQVADNNMTAEPARQIVAFGDSLYAGYRLGPKEGFVPQLQADLRSKGYGVTVRNAGVSGDTTAAGLRRINFVLDNVDQKIELLLLGLGGNDMLRGIKPAETRANLKAILDELKKRSIPVMLTGMVAAPNLGPDYAREFNAIYADLAKEYDAPLYPFFLDGVVTNGSLMLADNVHPNADGVAKVVGQLSPLVEKALDKEKS
ncbi:MAG: arylesterase [Sphingorhabdus sp.]